MELNTKKLLLDRISNLYKFLDDYMKNDCFDFSILQLENKIK